MKASAFAEVVLKLLGAYWLVTAVLALPGLAGYRAMASSQDDVQAWKVLFIPVLTVVLYLALGLWLVTNARRLALRLAPPDEGPGQLSVDGFQAAAFSVLGVYFVGLGLSGAATDAANFFLLEGRDSEWVRGEFLERSKASLFSDVVYLVSGVSLFFGASGLARLWRRLRPLTSAEGSGEAR